MAGTVRLDKDLEGPVKAAAEKAGVSGTRFVNDAVRRALADPAPAPAPAGKRKKHARPVGDHVACTHPAEKNTVFGWGTLCDIAKGGCGRKIR